MGTTPFFRGARRLHDVPMHRFGKPMIPSPQTHILIFEPRLEGHHLSWLRYITGDFVAAGFTVTAAVDGRPEAGKRIREHLSEIINKISLISVFDPSGTPRSGSMTGALAACLKESGADEVFLNNLDEIASDRLRCAALGVYPPVALRGRLSGVYFRPRFLEQPAWPPGNTVKRYGFGKLCREKWFKRIYFMDERLVDAAQTSFSGPSFHFLPDPWDGEFTHDRTEARALLGIREDQFVLLNYGIGDRRKGLHLVVQAMQEIPDDAGVFLLCAGRMSRDQRLTAAMTRLVDRGRALVLDRYVSDREESLCFCAGDAVMLPYLKHFGSSGVLSLAAAAGKMVIASDAGLVGRRVRDHNLGWLFRPGDVNDLKQRIIEASRLSEPDMQQFRNAAARYAPSCSRTAFKDALLSPFSHE